MALFFKLIWAFIQVFKYLGLFEVPLIKQTFHYHVHLIFQKTINRYLGNDAYSLLYKASWYRVFLWQQRCFYLSITTNTMKETTFIMQDEIHLAEFCEVTTVRKSLLGNLLNKAICYYLFRLVIKRGIDVFNDWTFFVMEPNQEHMFYLFVILLFKFIEHLLSVFYVACIEKWRPLTLLIQTVTTIH